MALSMLIGSGLPSVFWYKSVTHSVYLHNRLPTKTARGYMAPLEFLHGDPPDLRNVRVWGAKAWVILPQDLRRKEWKDKARTGYYMGESTQPIGHRIWVPDLEDEYITVHCTIDENIPLRQEEYYEEIDNLQVKTDQKEAQVSDFKYLVGLKHIDEGIPYETTRVVERRGLIVGYRKVAKGDNETEEQTPIHIRDIEEMTFNAQELSTAMVELKEKFLDEMEQQRASVVEHEKTMQRQNGSSPGVEETENGVESRRRTSERKNFHGNG